MNPQDWTVPPPIVGPASVELKGAPWHLGAVGAETAWKRSRGAGCKVGIVDTGIDDSHPELQDRIGGAQDFTGSRKGYADFQGHGSHVAGIIAGKTVGIAPDSKVWMAKGLGDNGSGTSRQIVKALEWLGSQGVHVVNMSLGSPYADPYIHAAIQGLVSAGIAVICAAGNSGPLQNTGEYPGEWNEVLETAAVDASLTVADFSSRSPNLDIAGPGVKVLSARAGGGYVEMSGTSMATPGVVGCYALAWTGGVGDRNPEKIRQTMFATAKDIDSQGLDPNTGWGFVNPVGMLDSLVPVPVPPVPVPPSPPTPEPPPAVETVISIIGAKRILVNGRPV